MGHLVKRNGHRPILAIVRLLETRAVVEVFLAVNLQSVQLCCHHNEVKKQNRIEIENLTSTTLCPLPPQLKVTSSPI